MAAFFTLFTAKTKALAAEVNANFAAVLTYNKYNEDLTPLVDGFTATFVTAALFKPGTLRVYLDGKRKRAGALADYVEAIDVNGNGTGFTLNSTPLAATPLILDYQKANA